MKAMILRGITSIPENPNPLELTEVSVQAPEENEVLIRVSTCGVCHTELDEIEGRTPPPKFPVIPGHQVVGIIEGTGSQVSSHSIGDRVGVAWIFSSCGVCKFCLSSAENLCPDFKATGRDVNGGYAEFMTVPASFVHRIPDGFSDIEAAPLLCAGAIGYRSLRLTGMKNGNSLGLTGFGGSGHITLKLAKRQYPDSHIYVFSRTASERDFAVELGADWAGDIDEEPPEKMDAIIDTTPVWKPVVCSMRNLTPGGRLVINAIRKESADQAYLQNLDYPNHLWMEKEIKSVANVTRSDVKDFLNLASKIPLKPETQIYNLEDANQALVELKTRKIRGAKVLKLN
jgi:propanol-preferring alcohol dehydrogenase